jgi:arsenate reductase
MQELEVDLSSQRLRSMVEFRAVEFDRVIMVCNHLIAARPGYAATAELLHVGFEDPAKQRRMEEESLVLFRRVKGKIKGWIERTIGGSENGED